MVSYADMITIIMAFFVVLYATSSGSGRQDKGHDTAKPESKAKQDAHPQGQSGDKDSAKASDSPLQPIFHSLYARFGPDWTLQNCWIGGSHSAAGRQMRFGGEKRKPQRGVENEKGQGIPPGKYAQFLVPGGRIYFAEFLAILDDQAKRQLRGVADEMAGKLQRVELRGHTTRRPLPADSPFRDHDDLAYARCRAVRDFLLAEGVDPRRIRMSIAGATEPAPRDEDLLQTREDSRVDVHLLNEWLPASPEE